MICKFAADGFKTLREFEIDLGLVNVFIGSNGCGKSNILEAAGVLSAAASGQVDDEALLRRGVRPGLPGLYRSSFKGDRTPTRITLSAKSGMAEYTAALLNPLHDPKPAWEFSDESLRSSASMTSIVRGHAKTHLDPRRGLAALKSVELPRDDPARMLLEHLHGYAIHAPRTSTLRGVDPDPQSREPVGLSGGRLAAALNDLLKLSRTDDRIAMGLEDILGHLDWVEKFDIVAGSSELLSPSVPRSKEIIRFMDRYMVDTRKYLTAYDASEGALFALFAAVLALAPAAPAFLAVDNLDQALNPRLARELTRLVSEWILSGQGRQILFTGHNPAMIDGLDLRNDDIRLFAVDRNQAGQTRARRILVTPELASLAAENDWPLSRLWMMGHLGGVPNV